MGLGEAAETVHQPFGCKVGRCAHRERAGLLPLQQALGAGGDPVESIPHNLEVGASRLGDDEALSLAIEELEAQLGLERLDLVTDRALGDAKFLRGTREALVTCL